MKDLFYIICAIITIALCMLLVRWVVNADIPLWLKVFILR